MRTGLFMLALGSSALSIAAPASAAVSLGTISGIINQLHNNTNLTPNGFAFSITQNGQSQTLFTGLSGLHQYNDITGFNAFANPPSNNPPGWGSSYQFTYSALGSFFNNSNVGGTVGRGGGDGASRPASVSQGAVPEPATWAMMIFGFGMIGLTMRRRNNLQVIHFS